MLKFGLYSDSRGMFANRDLTHFTREKVVLPDNRLLDAIDIMGRTEAHKWRLIAYEEESTTEGQAEEG